jgi:hypothetical protein
MFYDMDTMELSTWLLVRPIVQKQSWQFLSRPISYTSSNDILSRQKINAGTILLITILLIGQNIFDDKKLNWCFNNSSNKSSQLY